MQQNLQSSKFKPNTIKSQKTVRGLTTTVYDLPPEYHELRALVHPASVVGITVAFDMDRDHVKILNQPDMTYAEAIAYIKAKFEEHKDPTFYISMLEQDRKTEERARKEALIKAAKKPKEHVAPGMQLAKRRVRRILTKSEKKTGIADKVKALAYLEKHLKNPESIATLKTFFEL